MNKRTSELSTLFNLIIEKNISFNDFYCLYCIKEKISPSNININESILSLLRSDLLQGKNGKFQITDKGFDLMDNVESYFSAKKKSSNSNLMGEDFEKQIISYNNEFPSIKLPSGKPGRSNKKAIAECFKWFFENYSYDWNTILKATSLYVEHFSSKRYLYMQTSQYFIRKQNIDKTWRSDLADWCDMVINGEDVDNQDFFKEKVV